MTTQAREQSVEMACMPIGERSSPRHVDQVVLAASAVITVLVIGWILGYSRYGIDFTDEGYYLAWISNPFSYSASVTQFGFVYHPLFLLLGGDISGLRQANALITFTLACILANVFLAPAFPGVAHKGVRFVAAAGIAVASLVSLVFADLWLPTPSYNTLAFQALLLAAIGLLLSDETISRRSVAGWALTGIAGWLAFMAKPSTAVALGLAAGVYLLLSGKFRLHLLLVSLAGALALLALSAFAIDGSIGGFAERLRGGLELGEALGGGHTFSRLVRLDALQLSGRGAGFLVAGSMVFFAAAYLIQSDRKKAVVAGTALSVALGLAAAAVVFRVGGPIAGVGGFQGVLLWSVPIAAILVAAAAVGLKRMRRITRPQLAFALLMAIFPHVYAFGSNGNYWVVAARAGIFWLCAGLAVLFAIQANRLTRVVLSLALAVQLVSVMLIQSGMETPYRQPQALYLNDHAISIGGGSSELILHHGYASYFSELDRLADQAGFKRGTPVIDLTGQSPGALYGIGAKAIGQAWLIGGYPGSEKFVLKALGGASCADLGEAWVLLEPEGPRSIPSAVLESFGADLPGDFERVGSVPTAEGAGGYEKPRVQYLLKPLRAPDTASSACLAARSGKR